MGELRQLQIWEKAHRLTLAVYKDTAGFPRDEMYGLTSQIRRSSSSIGANIAEGCGREGDADFDRFLQIAMGSASELEYHIMLAHDLGMLSVQDYESITPDIQEVKSMLTGFIKRLRSSPRKRVVRASG